DDAEIGRSARKAKKVAELVCLAADANLEAGSARHSFGHTLGNTEADRAIGDCDGGCDACADERQFFLDDVKCERCAVRTREGLRRSEDVAGKACGEGCPIHAIESEYISGVLDI